MSYDKYIEVEKDLIVERETGEVINFSDIKKARKKNAIKKADQLNQDLEELDVRARVVVIEHRNKEYYCKNIKSGYTFNKEFRVVLRDLMKSKELSKNARCFIGTMTPFITFPYNTIMFDYENPTLEEIKDVLGMGNNVLRDTLKELEYYQIINIKKENAQYIIYFNPFLFCGGYCVEIKTYNLFKNSIYNNMSE